MARIRSTGTRPELRVRRLAHSMGYRFRLHDRRLPGTPDLIFPKRRKIIFVHGCFWHSHELEGCRHARLPKSNIDYWTAKLDKNKLRDKKHIDELNHQGWMVLVIWECELDAGDTLVMHRIAQFLGN